MDGGLLSRLLDDPDLAPALRALPAPSLRQLILRVGLEDAGELIALASLEQLRDVFDEDLWRSVEPGRDEAFDATRFAVWLEVLLEGGETLVADRLAGMSEDFLVFAVSQLARVLDVEHLATWATDPREAELLDRILDVHLQQELDQFLLLSRHDAGWDAVLTALLALDQNHPQLLREVLCRCAAATHEEVGSAGALSSVLEGEELLLEDARAERDSRRAERGYVSPADARAFLALARTAPRQPEVDPVTRAHFRELGPRVLAGSPADAAGARPASSSLRGLLLEAGAESEGLPTAPEPAAAGTLFRQALGELLDADPDAHQRVIEELAYLANVLIAGDTGAARTWRPVEAAERVLELCDEGLRSAIPGSDPQPSAARDALLRWGAVGAFRLAWASRAASD
jgi:hypothetical protein